MDKFDMAVMYGQKMWGASTHAITRFIERNRFMKEGDYKHAISVMLDMMSKAVFLCYENRGKMAEIYNYKNWIFITKDSTIVTVYEKKGSIYEALAG